MFKKAMFCLIMFGLVAVIVEALVFLMNRVNYPDGLYDQRQEVMSRLNQ
jgi:hypothetical protein